MATLSQLFDANASDYSQSQQFEQGKFANPAPTRTVEWSKLFTVIKDYLFNKSKDASPTQAIPLNTLTRQQLLDAPNNVLFRLGHSTILIKMNDQFWLTDPVFAERASPVQWMGPKRFHQSPLTIEELPPIKGIIISHDHYDHLDEAAMLQLADKTEQIYTPLGVGDRLTKWGVDPARITQLDWWQELEIDGITLAATPTQHFSGRGLLDGNKTLWGSWVLISDEMRLFFSGDSGYFDGFKTIGDKYGPFDITLIETGAYDKNWPDVHMMPEESLQAHQDLRGKVMMPIHNGTFDLALHAWYAPFESITELAQQQGVTLTIPEMGEQVQWASPSALSYWWQEESQTEAVAMIYTQ